MQNIAKKIIPYLLILIALVGLFGLVEKASAADGICAVVGVQTYPMTREQCVEKAGEKTMERYKITWYDLRDGPNPNPSQIEIIKEASEEEKKAEEEAGTTPEKKNDSEQSPFEKRISKYGCFSDGFSVEGCAIQISYLLLVTLPSLLLVLAATFFNAIVALALHSEMYSSAAGFISNAWTVVRDLSNIFFILILLYIAVKIILDMGGHEAKQMIVKVVVIALLINFSMFFTKVIIDTSNVLALVFYNKLTVKTVNKDKVDENYIPATKVNERDISGALVSAFNPSKLLSEEFFKQAEERTQVSPPGIGTVIIAGAVPVSIPALALYNVYRYFVPNKEVPAQLMFGIIVISGLIIIFATYAFFVTGLSFLGRLIELWVLIIFSPFAFMSFAVPKLAGVDYIGWDAWIKRLVSVSFMAPIFMFFMYFIFLLIRTNIFTNLARDKESGQTTIETILFVLIPALVILILLLKATEFAKKGSGKFGEVVMAGAKVVGGITLGAVTGGTSMALRATAGAVMKEASQGESAKNYTNYKAGRLPVNALSWRDKTLGRIGHTINKDQEKVEHSSHARHELDKESASRYDGKKFSQLTGIERDEIRKRITRDHEGEATYGKTYNKLNAAEKAVIDARTNNLLATGTSKADELIGHSKYKQGLGSVLLQSSRTGTYDIRNLANVVAKEQTTGFAKMSMGLTGALASSMRGGLKQMGISYGTIEGKYFKDLGNTISEALKNVKINVDLSHVGEVKKEDDHGKGHGGGH